MLNTDDFIKRLEILFEHYGLNASLFADKIGVQRSSISHLLSGRNKPSLDFVLKIMDVFPDLNLYWILNGKGSLLQSEMIPETVNKQPAIEQTPPTLQELVPPDIIPSETKSTNKVDQMIPDSLNQKERRSAAIDRIVIFYTDGTFDDYEQKKENPNPK